MPSRKIKQVDGIGRKELSSAVEEFLRHCKLKNLAKATMAYYTEDLTYFQRCTNLKYVHEIRRETLEDFIDHEMSKGNKVTAINARVRGLKVFFKFCAEREYMEEFKYSLIKEDESLKEP